MEKGTFFLKKEKILKPSKRELVKCTLLKKAGHTDFLNLKNYIKLAAWNRQAFYIAPKKEK